ncbi:YjbF family lipoprotein [Rheinheimera sp. D18]|uniref:YjbF family lipoprotein n=1 Tax=Rheinheimera sp. D18 TaxID=2545632 RepID=UPI001FB7BC33|nr:YjbF family lipoprotein [Rheinheimera sp. D18]
MTVIKGVVAVIALSMLSACAGTYNAYIDTLTLAFAKPTDISLTLADVQAAKSDLLYVKRGERSQAAMALLHIEAGQHKWVSGDKALLIIEQGRIVRTTGFSDNLLYLSNTGADAIRNVAAITPNSSWHRIADWQHGEYGYALQSTFLRQEQHALPFFQHSFDTILVTEDVYYASDANFLRTDRNWKNYFWFDTASGTLIKSIQTLAPFAEPIEMIYISRIARLLPADKAITHE